MSRYRAPHEILTDKRKEFDGAFQTLISKHEITHRMSSYEHLQSSRLAECMVQTMKRALRKCLLDGGREQLDDFLTYVAMGYRMSKQKSIGYSPYFLIFGERPHHSKPVATITGGGLGPQRLRGDALGIPKLVPPHVTVATDSEL